MDKLAKVRAEVERRMLEDYNSINDEQDVIAQGVCAGIIHFIDSLQEEPVSEDLEKAAYKYADTEAAKLVDPKEFNDYFLCYSFTGEEIRNAFVEGSKWQKAKDQETIELAEDHAMLAGMEKMREQMLKDAVDGFVIEDIEEGNGDFLLSADYLPASMGLKDQQKVKVIVVKED